MKFAKLSSASSAALLLAACSPRDGTISREGTAQPPYRPSATIQDLMDAEIDPAADFIWDSIGIVITAAGTENRQPRTDEQWRELRRKAIILVEATNLLLVPGRRVAGTEFPSAGPGVLSSAQIEQKLQSDRTNFDAFAVAFREAAMRELLAIDHKDVQALSDAGEALDGACEACHVANWYPHEIIPPLPDFKSAQ
jgi:hypothetical protein